MQADLRPRERAEPAVAMGSSLCRVRTPTDALDQQFGTRFCRTQTDACLRR